MSTHWPSIDIDPVRRMRALSAAMPHTVLHECVIDAPLDVVWGIAGDLEEGVPRFEKGIVSVEVHRGEGELLRVTTHGPLGLRMEFDALLRRGWCVMNSRFADIGMAAAAEKDGRATRFAHFEGSRLLGRLGHGYFSRKVRRDMERLSAIARGV